MSEKIVSRSVYFTIFMILMVLTAATVLVARLNLGPFNTIVALTIAITKATVVVLYFMHLRYSGRLMHVVLISGVFWLLLMFTLTISDYLTRGWLQIAR